MTFGEKEMTETTKTRIDLLKRMAGQMQAKLDKATFRCMAPHCKQHAILSHSQQKKGQLKHIAEDGLVYAQDRNFVRALPQLCSGNELAVLRKSRIGEVSVFRGFCSQHDQHIFAPLERNELIPGNPQQAILLTLRAFSYEFAQKEINTARIKYLREVKVPEGLWDDWSEDRKTDMELNVRCDGPAFMSEALAILERGALDQVHMIWRVLDETLPISCCAVFSPLLERHNEVMRPWFGQVQPAVALNIIPGKNVTHVVFSWFESTNEHARWLTKVPDTPAKFAKLINQIALCETEDTCFRPSFWEGLSRKMQLSVVRAMRSNDIRGSLTQVPMAVRIKKPLGKAKSACSCWHRASRQTCSKCMPKGQ